MRKCFNLEGMSIPPPLSGLSSTTEFRPMFAARPQKSMHFNSLNLDLAPVLDTASLGRSDRRGLADQRSNQVSILNKRPSKLH